MKIFAAAQSLSCLAGRIRKLVFAMMAMLLVCSAYPALLAYAHVSGPSFEEEVGGYLVDVGYGPEVLEVGRSAFFDFHLLHADTLERASFSYVWVRIAQGQHTVFAGGLTNEGFGAPTLVYVFPRPGEYELAVRYQDSSGILAETSFFLPVSGDGGGSGLAARELLFMGGVGIMGMGFLLIVWRKNILKIFFRIVPMDNRMMLIGALVLAGIVFLASAGLFFAKSGGEEAPEEQLSPSELLAAADHIVEITDQGFVPEEISVVRGERVAWVNESREYRWPASDLHPTHNLYPEFDPREPLATGEVWVFAFDRVGEWPYHDHLRPNMRGMVRVVEE